MEMNGRGFSGSYRFGYQGSEKDNEVSGDGNSYTTEFRQLDPRLGRWFSVDPVFQPWQSPYTSMDNNPICLNDPLGLDPDPVEGQTRTGNVGQTETYTNGEWAYILRPITIIAKKKNTKNEEEGFWSSIGNGFKRLGKWLDNALKSLEGETDQDDFLQGNSENKPLGNSKQEGKYTSVDAEKGAGNGGDPSVQKAANNAEKVDITDFVTGMSAMLSKSPNRADAVRNRKPIARNNYDPNRKYYNGKFLGAKYRKVLDAENVIIDKYNSMISKQSLSDFELEAINKILSQNSDVTPVQAPKNSVSLDLKVSKLAKEKQNVNYLTPEQQAVLEKYDVKIEEEGAETGNYHIDNATQYNGIYVRTNNSSVYTFFGADSEEYKALIQFAK